MFHFPIVTLPEPRPDFVDDFATVYRYATDSVGKCEDCKTAYTIGDTVVLLGSYPGASNRKIVCLGCNVK